MSGGKYDYIQFRMEEVAESLMDKNNTHLQRAFGKHLKLVADALHKIDYVKPGDCSEGDEVDNIKKVLGSTKWAEWEIIEQDAKELMQEFKRLFPNK